MYFCALLLGECFCILLPLLLGNYVLYWLNCPPELWSNLFPLKHGLVGPNLHWSSQILTKVIYFHWNHQLVFSVDYNLGLYPKNCG